MPHAQQASVSVVQPRQHLSDGTKSNDTFQFNPFVHFCVFQTFNRFLCVGFAAGLPGLFGRNMVLYADEIVDRNEEKVYNINNNVCSILCHVTLAACNHVLAMPLKRFKNYINFYYNGLAENKR